MNIPLFVILIVLSFVTIMSWVTTVATNTHIERLEKLIEDIFEVRIDKL